MAVGRKAMEQGNAMTVPFAPDEVCYGREDDERPLVDDDMMAVQECVRTDGVTDHTIALFQAAIYRYYERHARRLPWRETTDPYRIIVSEVMLQQTQAERVIGKYSAFVDLFPDFASLARASLREVLQVWQGLGYNRRALALTQMAGIVLEGYGGSLPASVDVLTALPGIGNATACAVMAFAFNKPVVFIETNIRSVFIHVFFDDHENVSDRAVRSLVARTLDEANPRRWYNALMDYGARLKKKGANPSRRSRHYRRQGRFEGSNRQVRGKILAVLTSTACSEDALMEQLRVDRMQLRENLARLEQEGFVTQKDGRFSLV